MVCVVRLNAAHTLMKLEKIKKTYNDYKLELSWGQVEAIAAALGNNHSDPLADELYAEWQWYMERVPGPGEDEEEIDAQQKAAAAGGQPGAVEGEDLPIPMPPGSEAGTAPEGGGKQPTIPPEDEPTEAAIKLGADPNGGHGLPEEGMDGGEGGVEDELEMPPDTDRRLPEPPKE